MADNLVLFVSGRPKQLQAILISVPDVPESSERRIKAEAKKPNKTHASNLS
jgi:hypothetical protein